MEWEEAKARLGDWRRHLGMRAAGCDHPSERERLREEWGLLDAALQRVEELEREAVLLTGGLTDQQNRADRAEAEVRRLEGLIVGWHDQACEHDSFFGVVTAMMDEARRIREREARNGY